MTPTRNADGFRTEARLLARNLSTTTAASGSGSAARSWSTLGSSAFAPIRPASTAPCSRAARAGGRLLPNIQHACAAVLARGAIASDFIFSLPDTLILIRIIKTPYFCRISYQVEPGAGAAAAARGRARAPESDGPDMYPRRAAEKAPCGTLARVQTLPGSRARCSSQSSAALPRRTYRSSPPRVVGAATMVSARAFDRWRRRRGRRAASRRRGPRRFV